MTKLLLKLAVGTKADPTDAAVRSGVGKLSGIVGICCNAVLFIAKLVVGLLSGSVSILADAMNNLSDTASSTVTLLGFKLAEKPADREHPYGHARYEYLTALAGGVNLSLPMGLILVASIAVKLWLSRFNRKMGQWISSGALTAAAADSRNDCIATGATLVAAVLQGVFSWRVDGLMGLGVALFILYNGISLAKDTISPLLGEAASPELRRSIMEELKNHPKILGIHDFMVHDYGPGQRFGSLHVEMDSRENPIVCHELIDELERVCLEKHHVHMVIHYDPVVTDNPVLEEMKLRVGQILTGIDSRLTFHDLRMVQGVEHNNLIFDVSLPQGMEGMEDTIRQEIENALTQERQSTFHAVITFDPAEFN